MDLERGKFRGRLEDKRLEARGLELKMCGLRDAIRNYLDPFEPVENLELDVVRELAFELAGLQKDYLEVIQQIAAIRKALGR